MDNHLNDHRDHEHQLPTENEELQEDPMVQIIDDETGETFDFFIGDEFEYNEQLYYVLVPAEEEPSIYVIGKVIFEDGESFIETLTDEENEIVYDEYDRILADYFSESE